MQRKNRELAASQGANKERVQKSQAKNGKTVETENEDQSGGLGGNGVPQVSKKHLMGVSTYECVRATYRCWSMQNNISPFSTFFYHKSARAHLVYHSIPWCFLLSDFW